MSIMEQLGFSKRSNNDNRTNPEAFSLADATPRKEGEKRTYNLIILDESGSMESILSQALFGANETIRTIKKTQTENPEDNQMLSFVTFDSSSRKKAVRSIIGCEPACKVEELGWNQYKPCGLTPLYDAMGFSIRAMKENVKEGDSVLVTVITDGFENDSKTFSASMIKDMVDELRGHGWMFTYIGANQNSREQAGELGIHAAMDFEASGTGAKMMWRKMNSSHRAFYKKSRDYRAGRMSRDEFMDDEDFFSEKASEGRVTPERIVTLQPGEIFVFGSNTGGIHSGGAARAALDKFGAVMGQGEGLQGQSYAIPTTFDTVEEIRPYVDNFITFADANPQMTFLVTRIGCGIAGFGDEDIAPLFAGAQGLQNVNLPASFWKIINYRFKR